MCNQGDGWLHLDIRLSANEETLLHEEASDERPSGFILHTAHGGTDLGACASKVSPAGWDLE